MMNSAEEDSSTTRRSSRQKRKRRSGNDRVRLDVGGKIYTTAKSTLVSNSAYFKARFSSQWDERSEGSDDDEASERQPIFVDQDPDTFAVLLSYMRLGFMKRSDITEAVLMQADFFGMESLLGAIKCVAFRCVHPYCDISDDDIPVEFDKMYDGTLGAIVAGVLPAKIQPAELGREYAHLLVHDENIVEVVPENAAYATLCVEVMAPAHIVDPSSRVEANPILRFQRVPNCSTFLDAVNWLYLQGFVTHETDYKIIEDENYYRDYWFSRQVEASEGRAFPDNIVFDERNQRPCEERRKVAAISSFHSSTSIREGCLEADIGAKKRIRVLLPGGDQLEVSSDITKVLNCDTPEEQISWVQRHGYTKRETALEKIYDELTYRATCNAHRREIEREGTFAVMLFSKVMPAPLLV